MKLSANDVLVMPSLGFVLVDPRVLIGIQAKLVQFIELKQPLLSCTFEVKFYSLDSPMGFVFQFHRQMAGFTIDQSEG